MFLENVLYDVVLTYLEVSIQDVPSQSLVLQSLQQDTVMNISVPFAVANGA